MQVLSPMIVSILILIECVCSAQNVEDEQKESKYWNDLSEKALHESLKQQSLTKAKNAIIFLGDGMGVSTITSARTLRRQEEKMDKLEFETFPNVAMIKTYNVDYQVPDSAGTGTAYLTGVKTNMGVLGLNAKVPFGSEDCDLIWDNRVESIMMQALRDGKSIGIVTTTSITDATPAATYSHASSRYHEAWTPIKDKEGRCKDIARQLIEDQPGRNFSVILGGGIKNFLPETLNGSRKDDLDLFATWKKQKKEENLKDDEYVLVNDRSGLESVNYDRVKHLFGLFAKGNMLYDKERDDNTTEPDIVQMTEAAIKVLSKSPNGFFLLVEGGMIDKAHHLNRAYLSLYDTLAFNDAIEHTLNMVNLNETFVVVTADHSHGFTLNGYAKREESVFGHAQEVDADGVPYTTLLYATGPGHRDSTKGETLNDTSKIDYKQQAAISIPSATHGGEDVVAYAIGPMSHVMKSTQEQTYVAHSMMFATCVGPYKTEAHCKKSASLGLSSYGSLTIIIMLIGIMFR
ncbi:hypothetical protein RDWZM_007884 [Blomia tropicalis]|uniref:Alkaline phosphatase n=1 Tax=Blomia tropicalis TaxID=40697 RepID=A0A9Q0M0Q6_BLOTA|nr:hypothetical protein RDWZM_007884 [Blomia tropicalis]